MSYPDDIDDSPTAQALAAEQWRKLGSAAAQAGFSGELRRAINAARIPSQRLAADCGVEVAILESFREGEGELPMQCVNRLVEILGLALVPVAH